MNESWKSMADAMERQAKETKRFQKSFAGMLLQLPIPMSYEVWRHLHSVKGDDDE